MKLGLGLYRHALKPENYRFAKQAGATHLVVHLVDYYNKGTLPAETLEGASWGVSSPHVWTLDELAQLKADIEAEGMKLEALENFEPAVWHDVLLDGPKRDEQIENIKTIIRRMGDVGIPIMGYAFSIMNVWGWSKGPWARGGAVATGWVRELAPPETPIPNGQVWNMIYDPEAPPGFQPEVSTEEIRSRHKRFLQEVLPVAEQAGVKLALHPADPPLPVLRGTARLVTRPELYQEVIDSVPSRSNALEFCIGTLSEMVSDAMDVYEATETYSRQGKIGYVHFRNVRGKVPSYHEVFVDEGDTDMTRILEILYRNGYDGVIIPDHVPEMSCPAPWHAGMAHALGWMKAAITMIERYADRP